MFGVLDVLLLVHEIDREIAFAKFERGLDGIGETVPARSPAQYAYRGITVAPKGEGGKGTGGEVVYPPLPETETEVREIARVLNVRPEPPDVLLNLAANETGLRQAGLRDYRILHFATHADLPGNVKGIQDPFPSSRPGREQDDDGFLTLTEVLGLDRAADLAVLSACVTGRGKLMEGEGVASFARAFQYAGTPSVVVSLWEVASNAAVEYMKAFYSHLREGDSRAEALSRARKEKRLNTRTPSTGPCSFSTAKDKEARRLRIPRLRSSRGMSLVTVKNKRSHRPSPEAAGDSRWGR